MVDNKHEIEEQNIECKQVDDKENLETQKFERASESNNIESITEEISEFKEVEDMHIKTYIDNKFNEMSYSMEMNNSHQMEKINDTITKLTSGLNQLLSGMKSELEAVKNIAMEKEAKIQRYEEGYDQKNVKVFLKDLLRISDFANSQKENNETIYEIWEDLELLLENEGIEKINLSVNDIYDGNASVVKIVSTVDTDDLEKDNMVREIKKEGYFIEIADDQIKVIRPSEVILYKYQGTSSFKIFGKKDKK